MMQENNPSYPFIASLIKKYSGECVVDNGCGRNEFKRLYNKKIIGTEVKEEKDVDIITDGKNLPLKEKSVDVFLSNFVLEHVEDEGVYLKEMVRCVKERGRIILSVPRPLWYFAYFLSPGVWISPFKNLKSFVKHPLRFFTHGHPEKHSLFFELREWREERYVKMFKDFGLKREERYVTCNILSLNARYAKVFGKVKFPEWLNVHVTYVLKVD